MLTIKSKLISVFLLCLFLPFFSGCEKQPAEPEEQKSVLRLATTTSTVDSGLLDVLVPVFESKYNIKVDIFTNCPDKTLSKNCSG